jgi:predicted GTPase
MNQSLANRLTRLEQHLKAENPVLLEVLPTYYKFDKILRRMGLIERESSLASRISWWPLISVMGTFSSGKSSFINAYIGEKVQDTGNQAVDDKFTVICQRTSDTDANRTLPGTALDADPRFPFYRISSEIEKVAKGEGKHIESYLQLRTTRNPAIENKIIIDSPGFDADDQRRSTLRITDHIIDLSDLVLVFFDARHPEPGAMQDTLEHLVRRTAKRTDASKFLYILNQIDTAAKEDNPEDVVGAWQRAMAQAGLSAGQFFTIYNEAASVPIENHALRERFREKRDADLARIHARIAEVELHRNYRIVSFLETVAKEIEHDVLPQLKAARRRWRRGVAVIDALAFALIVAATGGLMYAAGWMPPAEMLSFDWMMAHRIEAAAVLIAAVVMAATVHFWARGLMARRVGRKLPEDYGEVDLDLRAAFVKGTRWFRTIFRRAPVGWGRRAAANLRTIRDTVAGHIQNLNDRYADPSAKARPVADPVEAVALAPAVEAEPATEPAEEPRKDV